jgi:hypothetical protein
VSSEVLLQRLLNMSGQISKELVLNETWVIADLTVKGQILQDLATFGLDCTSLLIDACGNLLDWVSFVNEIMHQLLHLRHLTVEILDHFGWQIF